MIASVNSDKLWATPEKLHLTWLRVKKTNHKQLADSVTAPVTSAQLLEAITAGSVLVGQGQPARREQSFPSEFGMPHSLLFTCSSGSGWPSSWKNTQSSLPTQSYSVSVGQTHNEWVLKIYFATSNDRAVRCLNNADNKSSNSVSPRLLPHKYFCDSCRKPAS